MVENGLYEIKNKEEKDSIKKVMMIRKIKPVCDQMAQLQRCLLTQESHQENHIFYRPISNDDQKRKYGGRG